MANVENGQSKMCHLSRRKADEINDIKSCKRPVFVGMDKNGAKYSDGDGILKATWPGNII